MLDFIGLDDQYFWALLGAVLIFLEIILGWPATVLFIGGLAGLTVSVVLACSSDYIDESYQVILFLVSCCVWFMICWQWLQKLISRSKKSGGYNGVIGQSAIVHENNLLSGDVGRVMWSGAICKASIDDGFECNEVKVGSEVVITKIKNNIFFVRPV